MSDQVKPLGFAVEHSADGQWQIVVYLAGQQIAKGACFPTKEEAWAAIKKAEGYSLQKEMEMKDRSLVGKKIVAVRQMSKKELEDNGWEEDRIDGAPAALVLDDGSVLYPSRDIEGNGPGSLFGQKGETFFTVVGEG